MAGTIPVPNPIPLYESGDITLGGTGNPITTTATDLDGADGVLIYTVASGAYPAGTTSAIGLLKKVIIYTRGVNAGGKAYLWIDAGGASAKEFVAEATVPASTVRGQSVVIDLQDNALDPRQSLQGILMREGTTVYLQIEDAGITDGYRAYAIVRDVNAIAFLKAEQI